MAGSCPFVNLAGPRMTLQRISEHVQPTGTAAAAASSHHSPPRRFVPDFLENPMIDDNADLEIITKTSPSVAANMISGPSFHTDPEPSCQPIKTAPTKTHPRRPPHTIPGVPASKVNLSYVPPIIMLLPMPTRPVCVAWPLARPHSRARMTISTHCSAVMGPLLRSNILPALVGCTAHTSLRSTL